MRLSIGSAPGVRLTLLATLATLALAAGVLVGQARAGWISVQQCVVNSVGGHLYCHGYSSAYTQFQFKSKVGGLNKPYTWLQKRASGSLTWGPSPVISNDNWQNAPNVLAGTGYITEILTDNRYPGNVDGVYQHNAYLP